MADAARVCRLLSVGDPDAYDRAAVHWIRRFVAEARDVTFDELLNAVTALDTLPDDARGAMQMLSALCRPHRLGH